MDTPLRFQFALLQTKICYVLKYNLFYNKGKLILQ